MTLPPMMLLLLLLLALAATTNAQLDPKENWLSIKEGLKQNKQEMCSFLLGSASQDNSATSFTLEGVSGLFEQALDHLAKSVSYVSKIRPHVDRKLIDNFDRSGSLFVLDISEARRKLIEEFEQAEKANADEKTKQAILERYFYQACTKKLGTIVTEKSMYDSLVKLERLARPAASEALLAGEQASAT